MVVATHTHNALETMEMGSTPPTAPLCGGAGDECPLLKARRQARTNARAPAVAPPGEGPRWRRTRGRVCLGGPTTACHRSRAPALTRRLAGTRQTVRARSLPPVPGLFPAASRGGPPHTRLRRRRQHTPGARAHRRPCPDWPTPRAWRPERATLRHPTGPPAAQRVQATAVARPAEGQVTF